ncbi:MAG: SRPBCC domain-containing protein [Christiangramia sp.]
MQTDRKTKIIVQTTVPVSLDLAWEIWTKPEHIVRWNFASKDWHCPRAENDLKPNGKFSWRMEAKDASVGFDYSGVYEKVIPKEKIIKKLDDGRLVEIDFSESENEVGILETFEVEDQNSVELQKTGWQAILDNFKAYAISKK